MVLSAMQRCSLPLVREAARLLRIAESAARSAASCLAEAEAEFKAQAHIVPPGATVATAADGDGAPRSRSALRRAKEEKKKMGLAPEVMPCDDGDVTMTGGVLDAAASAAALVAAAADGCLLGGPKSHPWL